MLKITDPDFQYPSLASYVADEMFERNWTCVDVARAMGGEYKIDVATVNIFLVISPEKILVTDSLIDGLAKSFGVSSEFLKSLHQTWMDHPENRENFECPDDLLDGLVFPSIQ